MKFSIAVQALLFAAATTLQLASALDDRELGRACALKGEDCDQEEFPCCGRRNFCNADTGKCEKPPKCVDPPAEDAVRYIVHYKNKNGKQKLK